MKYLESFVQEYKKAYLEEEIFDDSIIGEIKRVQKLLLHESFNPSTALKTLFDKLLRRAQYPMEVAIVGQFSSGKSTFLNALLSKDILPTGITPVTSKVNFLNYGEEYKLKVTYKNGANEYHALENINKFTDQRESVEEIKYLSLYAPLEILKEISFVDTPGLNSQSLSDTKTTKKILRDVDGIIWLSLIDSAGKESEAEILTTYLKNFKNKSLCVLNQKDKFSEEQLAFTLDYIKTKFSEYFSEVIPISAKQALDSRVQQQDILIQEALFELQDQFKKMSKESLEENSLAFFEKEYQYFHEHLEKIKNQDCSQSSNLLKESNISAVLDFIENTIRPKAKESKAFALQKDLASICEILTTEYQTLLLVYENLESILREKEDEVLKAYDEVFLKHSKSLYNTYDKVESILQSIADTIYQNINSEESVRYSKEKNLLQIESIKEYSYTFYKADTEAILEKLFFHDQYIDKQIKSSISFFKNIELESSEDFREVFRILKHAIQAWQTPYENLYKNREIASDTEFATTRQFVSKVYENVLLEYHRATLGNISALRKKFAYFNGALSFSYKQITQQCIYEINERLQKDQNLYLKDPLKFSINAPNLDTVKEIVFKNFSFEKIDIFLNSRRNYLFKIIQKSKAQFEVINQEKLQLIIHEKKEILEKIEMIRTID